MADDWDDLIDTVQDIDEKARKATIDGVDEGMDDFWKEVSKEVINQDLEATRNLTESTPRHEAVTEDKRTDTHIEYTYSLPGEYAYVEYGTGAKGSGSGNVSMSATDTASPTYPSPDNPPIAAIDRWASAKGVEPYDADTSYYEMVEKIAWEIVRNGTEAHPFLRPAWESRKGWRGIVGHVNQRLERIVLHGRL